MFMMSWFRAKMDAVSAPSSHWTGGLRVVVSLTRVYLKYVQWAHGQEG